MRKGEWLIVSAGCLMLAVIAFVAGLANPFGVVAKAQFDATGFESQLGAFATFIAFAFMGIPAGIILTKFGYKKALLAALIVGSLGVLTMILSGKVESFGIYLAGSFISGFAMCMINTTANPMLNEIGGGYNNGNRLLQIGGACNSAAATIIPLFAGYLIGEATGATIADVMLALYIAFAIYVIAFFAILLLPVPNQVIKSGPIRLKQSLNIIFKSRRFVFGMIAIFVYVGIENCIPNFVNLYLTQEIETTAMFAGKFVSIYWGFMLVGRIIGSVISKTVSSQQMLMTSGFVVFVLVIIGIVCGKYSFVFNEIPIAVILFVATGLFTSIMFPAIFNLSVIGLEKHQSIASGVLMTLVCGGGVLPPIQGLIADVTSYMTSYILVAIGAAYIFAYAFYVKR